MAEASWLEEQRAGVALLARGAYQDCLDAMEDLCRRHPEDALCRAMALEAMGRAHAALRQPAEAVSALEESLRLLRQCEGPRSPLTLGVMQNLAFALEGLGRLDAAIDLGTEAAEGLERTCGPQSPRLAECLLRLSSAWYRRRHFERAEGLVRRALAIWEAQGNREKMGTCYNNLGRIHEERGDLDAGVAWHRKALALRERVQGEHEDTAFSHGNLGVALAMAGHLEEAAEHLQAAVDMYGRLGKAQCPEALGYAENLGVCRSALAEGA